MSYIPFTIFFSVIGLVVGFLVYFYPVSVMRFQVKFYKMINWRIEPISLQKEFDRTRNAGIYLIILSVLAGVCVKFFI